VGYAKIQVFVNKTQQVKIIAMNIYYCEKTECRSVRIPPWKPSPATTGTRTTDWESHFYV